MLSQGVSYALVSQCSIPEKGWWESAQVTGLGHPASQPGVTPPGRYGIDGADRVSGPEQV